MSMQTELPESVLRLLETCVNAEFATVSSAGVPIDTPMLIFADEGLRAFNVGTGVAYPSKANRARKNPKVGLLYEGKPDEPVVAMAGMAAVKDADLQASTRRYLAETAFARVGPAPWPLARKAVWYWTRMLVNITPARILWWDNAAAMDGPPHRWAAPANTAYPKSDPTPSGAPSVAPKWPERQTWQEQARDSLARNAPGHLTLCDAEGFPLPIRARAIRLTPEGFHLDIPKGAPWARAGKATFTFEGRSTFVGEAKPAGAEIFLGVERTLPVSPFVADTSEVWEPKPSTYEAIMGRLKHELARRGQSIPTLPENEPELTEAAKIRFAHITGTPNARNVFGFKEAQL